MTPDDIRELREVTAQAVFWAKRASAIVEREVHSASDALGCPDCGGTGTRPDGAGTCLRCGGEGDDEPEGFDVTAQVAYNAFDRPADDASAEPSVRVEILSAKLHAIYQQEARRQAGTGEDTVRHPDDYDALPEHTKEYDRVLARYILRREANLVKQMAADKSSDDRPEGCTCREITVTAAGLCKVHGWGADDKASDDEDEARLGDHLNPHPY